MCSIKYSVSSALVSSCIDSPNVSRETLLTVERSDDLYAARRQQIANLEFTGVRTRKIAYNDAAQDRLPAVTAKDDDRTTI